MGFCMFSWGTRRLEGCRGGGLSTPSCSMLKMCVTAGITQMAPEKTKAVPGLALLPEMLIVERLKTQQHDKAAHKRGNTMLSGV